MMRGSSAGRAASASAANAATEHVLPVQSPAVAFPATRCPSSAHTEPAFRHLVARAAKRFQSSGRSSYYFARGKLGGDPVFAALLRDGRIVSGARIVDIGCGLGVLPALLAAAEQCDARPDARWPRRWAPAPRRWTLHGIDLRVDAIATGRRALADLRDRVSLAAGDVRSVRLPVCDVVAMIDVLHYIDRAAQNALLANVAAALMPGGMLLMRVGDAAGRWRFRLSVLIDAWITVSRGGWPRVYCRTLAEWLAVLEELDFAVTVQPMSEGTPFANVLLIATTRA